MSNYYSNQLTVYNEKYDDAISKITNIESKINKLAQAFTGAIGTDINQIEVDLASLSSELDTVKKKLENAKKTTNTNATNSDIVYDKAILDKGRQTPKFKGSDDYYISTGPCDVYLEDGIIYKTEYFRRVPCAHEDSILGGIIQAFNDYPLIKTTVKAFEEEMILGNLSWVSAYNKSGEVKK